VLIGLDLLYEELSDEGLTDPVVEEDSASGLL
jgi:hypothetical protein